MPASKSREYRNMLIEVRKADDEQKMIVEGYATTFNEPYVLYSYDGYEVQEQIDGRAFDECDMSDVIMQYDHNGRVFARTSNGTLKLSADEKGLYVVADLSGTQEGRALYEEIKGGYTTKMSFGFVINEDNRTETHNKETGQVTVLRTITGIKKLYDVSAVSIPANDMTEISARTLSDGVIAEIKAERLLAQKRKKLELKLKMMEV